MISVSPAFLAAMRTSHVLATQATVYPADGSAPFDIPIEDGTITLDRTADQRRGVELTISDGTLYPIQPTDLVNVYGAEVVVKRGVRFADGDELAQLGVFRIESLSRDIPGGGVTLEGWDRSRQVADRRFLKPRKFDSTRAIALIKQLITEVYPDAQFSVLTNDTTTIPKHVVDRDRWPEVQRVAQVIGCEVFQDQFGTWIIQDVPDIGTQAPVWAVDAGPTGVLVAATDSVTREGAPNVVVAIGSSTDGNRGVVTITHASPAVVHLDSHELVTGQAVNFSTSGTLPAPINASDDYYVKNVTDANHFTISHSHGGAAVDTTTDGTGTHKMSNVARPLYGIARDENHGSPTYYQGPFGIVPRFYESQFIHTQAQADRVAQRQLNEHLGVSRTINFQAVPNPALDAGDAITVVRPDGTTEVHLFDVLTIPLSASGEMTGETRAVDWSAQ